MNRGGDTASKKQRSNTRRRRMPRGKEIQAESCAGLENNLHRVFKQQDKLTL
jgi:hypothetical protein